MGIRHRVCDVLFIGLDLRLPYVVSIDFWQYKVEDNLHDQSQMPLHDK